MLTIISFILTILGCINWLMVGLLQYDFVAGIFGYQSSILSRIVYIIVGVASLFLVFKLIKGKGTIAVFSFRNKQDLMQNIKKIGKKDEKKDVDTALSTSNVNVEASKSLEDEGDYSDEREYDETASYKSREHIDPSSPRHQGLFNEHFGDRDDF